VGGDPISFFDPTGLIPSDKKFGIKDPGFWKWWEKNKEFESRQWFCDADEGFNLQKPNDIPNKSVADAIKDHYDNQEKNNKPERARKPRGRPGPGGVPPRGGQD
jgi:hypothetical protein